MCPNCGTELEDADVLSITEFLQILGNEFMSIEVIPYIFNRVLAVAVTGVAVSSVVIYLSIQVSFIPTRHFCLVSLLEFGK